jgi:hypothetical protein
VAARTTSTPAVRHVAPDWYLASTLLACNGPEMYRGVVLLCNQCLLPLGVHAVAEYVLEFQKCLDRTDPIPYSTIRGIMQQELKGRSIESIFSYVNPEPLASASVAQVGALHQFCVWQHLRVACAKGVAQTAPYQMSTQGPDATGLSGTWARSVPTLNAQDLG